MAKLDLKSILIAGFIGGIGLNLILLPTIVVGASMSNPMAFINGFLTGAIVQIVLRVLNVS